MDRRDFLLLLFASTSITAVLAGVPDAAAKNGGDDGDDSDSDSDRDSDSSGSGSGRSGGDDDSGSDDSDDNDSDDDSNDDDGDSSGNSNSNSGSGSSKSGRDHQKAREAVGQGRILPLREILRRVEDMGGGRVIAVNLDLEARKPFYTLKVQSGASVRTLKLDAASGRRLTLFGW